MNTCRRNTLGVIPTILTSQLGRSCLGGVVEVVDCILLRFSVEDLNIISRVHIDIGMERAGFVAGSEEEVVEEDAVLVVDVLEVDREHVPARLDGQRIIADNNSAPYLQRICKHGA